MSCGTLPQTSLFAEETFAEFVGYGRRKALRLSALTYDELMLGVHFGALSPEVVDDELYRRLDERWLRPALRLPPAVRELLIAELH